MYLEYNRTMMVLRVRGDGCKYPWQPTQRQTLTREKSFLACLSPSRARVQREGHLDLEELEAAVLRQRP